MPSLSALDEFKSSFGSVGNEKNDLLLKKLPFNDLKLPDTEASPMDFSEPSGSDGDSSAFGAGGTNAGGFEFLSDLSGSVPVPELIEPPSADDPLSETEPADSGFFGGDDFSAASGTDDSEFDINEFLKTSNEEISSGGDGATDAFFPDSQAGENFDSVEEIETINPVENIEPIADSEDDAIEGIDLGGESRDISFPEQDSASETGEDLPDVDLSGIDFPEADTPDADFSGADLPEADILDTNLDNVDFPETDLSGAGFPETDIGAETVSDLETFPSGADSSSDFDTSLPKMDFETEPSGGPGEDTSFDGAGDFGFGEDSPVDLGGDFSSDSIELENESDDSDFGAIDFGGEDSQSGNDFTLPGLEDIFEKQSPETAPKPAPKKGFFRRKKAADIPEAEADIEEIRLSQGDLDKLLKTLSSYPLNLRVACEEMIAEQVLLPNQLSKLIRLLMSGAYVRETADFVEEVTGKKIVIPKSFEKMTGAAFEAEQSSLAYIFIHNFLPVLRTVVVIAAIGVSVLFLGYRFIYIPIKAEGLYKRGYERIPAGEYQRANQLFHEALLTHQKKKWFYLYAEAFRDQRRYLLAEEKYDELLSRYPRDKKGVLDYARLQTYYLLNYEKANNLLQQRLLDYSPDDFDGLLAAGDNFLLWADSDPARFFNRYEDARFSYARMLEKFGWRVPIVERMLVYFIRVDNLKEVINLRVWFESQEKRRLSPSSIAELAGYLLDKQLEIVKGVPDPYLENIESVRAMLLQAIRQEPALPETHYHLARYYNSLDNTYEERLTLENAIRAFDLAATETTRRRLYRVDTHFRYANLLVESREFFPAEEQLVTGIKLYEDFMSRNLIQATSQLGRLYAAKGDIEYFVKSGDMRAALSDYRLAERYDYAPPEIQYRMGAAYYQLQDWRNALEYMFKASSALPFNRRLLYALGNAAYQRGDYFAAQGYYDKLLDILENQRLRLPLLLPNDSPQFLELGERLMMARNNAGVVYEALAGQTGNREYRSKALALYAESSRAWDSITRNPETMVRSRLTDMPGSPGINLGYLNAGNAMRSRGNYAPEIFVRVDKDVNEPSRWEELAPIGGLR